MDAIGIDGEGLKRFLEAVSRRYPLQRAILFGSRARGDALISSDYDLILVSPAFARMPFAERAARVLEFWTLEAPLEALCYTPEEFEQKAAGLTMIREAREQGIELRLPDASDPACNAPDLLV